jgi:hypothetical protein
LASKLEFSVAKIESQLTSYMQWLEDNYPEKFADVFSNQRQVVLPDSEEFQQMLELKSREDYALSIREAIEGFSWPYKLLQKLSLYERRGREVEELMMSTCAAASNVARSLSDALPLPQGLEQIAAALRLCLAKVKERQKYICWPRANEKYESARSGIADEFAIYRKRHELALQEQYGSAGYATFAQELDIIGGSGNLPTGGIFSPHIADALKALANA